MNTYLLFVLDEIRTLNKKGVSDLNWNAIKQHSPGKRKNMRRVLVSKRNKVKTERESNREKDEEKREGKREQDKRDIEREKEI